MSEPARHAELVERLAGGLGPVRRLPGPGFRALGWLGAAVGLGIALTPMADMEGLGARMGTPDLRMAALGAALTAVSAAVAAFQVSVPGRSLRWALLPVLPAILWVGASGLGCLRNAVAPGTALADARDGAGCFVFLVGVSLPLSVLLVLMLRRACPLHPTLTAVLGGLAASAAAAVLLLPFHPHDATATDLAMHLAAVTGIVWLNAILGGRLLSRSAGMP